MGRIDHGFVQNEDASNKGSIDKTYCQLLNFASIKTVKNLGNHLRYIKVKIHYFPTIMCSEPNCFLIRKANKAE